MGASQSVQPDPIPDPNIFINIGCVGLDSTGYNSQRLSAAPFLSINFQAGIFKTVKNKKEIDNIATYNAVINNIRISLEKIKPGWRVIPVETASNDLSSLYNFNNSKKLNTNNGSITSTNNGITSTNKSKSGFDAEANMEERLKELADLLNADYEKNKDNFGKNNYTTNDIWKQQGGSLNGQTMAYWNTKYVYGPVYLLVAQDNQTKILDCYLYFPSMTKDSMLWPNINYLGLAHNWMHMLLYGIGTRMQWCFKNDKFAGFSQYTDKSLSTTYQGFKNPCLNGYTKCKQTFNPMRSRKNYGAFRIYKNTTFFPNEQKMEDRFMFGCKTNDVNNPYACQQSQHAHKAMGLYNKKYDKNKSKDEYPVAYYHAYALRFSDRRINSYINNGPYSLQYLTQTLYNGTSCGLAKNILPAYTKLLQGCSTALVSQNNMYYLVLGGKNLTLYKNTLNNNLSINCANNSYSGLKVISNIPFKNGGTNSYLIIEENNINIYSAPSNKFSPSIVKSMPFTDINSGKLASQYSLILNNNGTIQIIDVNNNISGSLDGSFATNDITTHPYNKNDDYNRRLLNLKLYLIFRNIYIDAQTNANSQTIKTQISENIPEYNSATNYMQRMLELLTYLESQNKISKGSASQYRQSMIQQTGRDINGLIEDDTDTQLSELITDSGNNNDEPDQQSTADNTNKDYQNDIVSTQAQINSKAQNEANPSEGVDPNPCVGYLGEPSCVMNNTEQAYIPANVSQSLNLLQEQSGANSLFSNTSGSDNPINKIFNNDVVYSKSQKERKLYMEKRLEELKSYLEIKKQLEN